MDPLLYDEVPPGLLEDALRWLGVALWLCLGLAGPALLGAVALAVAS